jgi:nicotinamidase-related amidase
MDGIWAPGGPVDPHLTPRWDSSALLVIDTQVDFLDGGTSPIPGTSAVLPALTDLVRAFRAAGRPIAHVVRLYAGDDPSWSGWCETPRVSARGS